MAVRITLDDIAKDTGATNRMDMVIIITCVVIVIAGGVLLLI